MIEKPAAYLDSIMKVLSEDFNKLYTLQQIQNKIQEVSFFGDARDIIFAEDDLSDLKKALKYLGNSNLVEYVPSDGTAKLTYEGYIKIKTNSFSKEISRESIHYLFQRLGWIVTTFIALLALAVALFK